VSTKKTNLGSAYIFFRDSTGWVQKAELIAGDRADGDSFGFSVAIDGEYAIVGAVGDDVVEGESGQGSAYIFKRKNANPSSWTEQAKLTAQDGAAYDHFGHSVAIDGEYAIVGAYGDDVVVGESGQGSAYIFKKPGSGWTDMTETAKLTAGTGGDHYGFSVAIDGEYAIVGATSADPCIFKRSGILWTEQQKLTASDGASGDNFGHSVAIDGEYAIVGAYGDAVDGKSDQGSAYLFKRDGTSWSEQKKLIASDSVASDIFGRSVAIDGNHALVGAPHDDDNGDDSGSAYVYDISGEDPSIPEFSTIAIPIAALLGLVFLFSRRRGREE
jgi:hypothetical protein